MFVEDLFCAPISTLTDEAGAIPAANNNLARPEVESVDMRDYQRPVLAYVCSSLGQGEG